MAFGMQIYTPDGIEVMHTSRPFNIVARVRVINLGGLSGASIPIPDVAAGSVCEVVSGLMGGSYDFEYDAGGGVGLVGMNTVSMSGSTLNLDTASSSGGKTTWTFTIFAGRR